MVLPWKSRDPRRLNHRKRIRWMRAEKWYCLSPTLPPSLACPFLLALHQNDARWRCSFFIELKICVLVYICMALFPSLCLHSDILCNAFLLVRVITRTSSGTGYPRLPLLLPVDRHSFSSLSHSLPAPPVLLSFSFSSCCFRSCPFDRKSHSFSFCFSLPRPYPFVSSGKMSPTSVLCREAIFSLSQSPMPVHQLCC